MDTTKDIRAAHQEAAKALEKAPHSKEVCIPAGAVKALGGQVEAGTPDERPIKMSAKDYKALAGRSAPRQDDDKGKGGK